MQTTAGHPEPGEPDRLVVVRTIRVALDEDTARGDVTSDALITRDARGKATMNARRVITLAGVGIARQVFEEVDPTLRVDVLRRDGETVEAHTDVLRVEGATRSILRAERVALNFAQRLSGVATLTRAHVAALAPGSKTRITDTRKTTPGLRALERYAVRCGGGFNHREDLGAAVLIKDNHIAAVGSVREAVTRARAYAPHTTKIECEVDSVAQIEDAIGAGADAVLLDNFTDAAVADSVALIKGRALVEVSGGITLDRIRTLSTLGVDVISVGALTHSAPAADLGLDWVTG